MVKKYSKLTKIFGTIGVITLLAGVSATPVQAFGSHVSTSHVSTSHVSTPHVSTPHVSTPHVSSSPHVSTPHVSTSTTHVASVPHTSVSARTPSISHSSVSSRTPSSSISHSSVSSRTPSSSISHSSSTSISSRTPSASTNHPVSNSTIRQSITSALPKTHTVTHSISEAQSTSTYHHLTNPNHQMDFVYWNVYRNMYYTHPYYHYYAWMPYWMYRSDTREARKFKAQAQQHDLKWIKVDDRVVMVPTNLWKKIKIGDHIQLIDDTHLKLNGHIYSK